MTTSLYVVAQGAMTPVGLNATQTCAAVRAGVSAYAESGFLLQNSQWEKVVAACLPLRPKPSDSKPIGRLLALAKPALEQCVTQSCFQPSETALLVGIPERARLSLFKQWYSEDIEDYCKGDC
jgi:3-oxoacyl-[acyl-carrier-protein] synthase I